MGHGTGAASDGFHIQPIDGPRLPNWHGRYGSRYIGRNNLPFTPCFTQGNYFPGQGILVFIEAGSSFTGRMPCSRLCPRKAGGKLIFA